MSAGIPPLSVTSGGKTWDLTGPGPFIAGRSPDADIVLSYPQVSRKHFALSFDGLSWVVEDLESTNGVYVGGTRYVSWRVQEPVLLSVDSDEGSIEISLCPMGVAVVPDLEAPPLRPSADVLEEADLSKTGGLLAPPPPPEAQPEAAPPPPPEAASPMEPPPAPLQASFPAAQPVQTSFPTAQPVQTSFPTAASQSTPPEPPDPGLEPALPQPAPPAPPVPLPDSSPAALAYSTQYQPPTPLSATSPATPPSDPLLAISPATAPQSLSYVPPVPGPQLAPPPAAPPAAPDFRPCALPSFPSPLAGPNPPQKQASVDFDDTTSLAPAEVLAMAGGRGKLTSRSAKRFVSGNFNVATDKEGLIGRTLEASISVTDPLVSRNHARIALSPEGPILTDLKSSNGTFVNGRRIKEVWLEDGDVVTVGNTDLKFEAGVLGPVLRKQDGVALVASGVDLVIGGGKRLLDDISVDLEQGTLTAIVGPSGAGKSTFSKVVAGLSRPTAGTVLLDGFDIHKNYDNLRSRIGFVPQDDVVHGLLTVDQAMNSAAKLRLPGASKKDREETIKRVLQELELTEHRSTRIDRLSGGQRKRVSTAIELLTGPELLLLDEPTSGLDPALDLTVMQMLRRLADAGRVVVVVTHSVAQLESTCDNILFLAPGGKTAYWGPMDGAKQAFHGKDWAQIFAEVAQNPSRAHAQHLSRQYGKPQVEPPRVKDGAPSKGGGRHGWSQGLTLIARQLQLTIADPGLLVFLLGLPLILGVLALIVPGEAGFGEAGLDAPTEANNLLVLLILGAAFMGAALSVRDLVSERHIYKREQSAGLSSLAYVASKFLILGGLTAIQAIELILVVGIWKDVSGAGVVFGSKWFELGLVVWLTAWSSAMLGLLASSMVKTSEQTMPVLVVLVMVQLVMTGGMVPVTDRAGLDQVSWFVPARWGFAAGASTIDLREMVQGVPDDSLWEPTSSQWLMNMGLIAAMILVATALTWWNVRLKKSRGPA